MWKTHTLHCLLPGYDRKSSRCGRLHSITSKIIQCKLPRLFLRLTLEWSIFYHSQVINCAMDESFTKWLNLLLHIPSVDNGEYFSYISQMEWYGDSASYTVASIAAFISVFTLNTYLPAAVIFKVNAGIKYFLQGWFFYQKTKNTIS